MKDQYFKIGSVLLLGTVTLTDNRQDTWLECIDDNGDKVRLVPDFLNAEDDDMGFLVNMDTGERITWGGELV